MVKYQGLGVLGMNSGFVKSQLYKLGKWISNLFNGDDNDGIIKN